MQSVESLQWKSQAKLSRSKHWIIINSSGERFEFTGGLVDFCKKYSLRYETLTRIANGFVPLRGKYQGWTVTKSIVIS